MARTLFLMETVLWWLRTPRTEDVDGLEQDLGVQISKKALACAISIGDNEDERGMISVDGL